MTIQEITQSAATQKPQEKSGESHADQGDFFDLILQTSADQSSPALTGDVSKVPSDQPNKPIKKADKEHKPVDLMDLTELALASTVMQSVQTQKPNLPVQASKVENPATTPVAANLLSELKQVTKPIQSMSISPDLIKSMSPDDQKDLAKMGQVKQPMLMTEGLKLTESMPQLQNTQPETSNLKMPLTNLAPDATHSIVKNALNNQDKLIHQAGIDKAVKQQPIDFNDAMQSQTFSITQPEQATQAMQTTGIAIHQDTGKIAQSLSALGSVIQSQVTAAMPNHVPAVENNIAINPTVSVDTILQPKKQDYEMSLDMPHDLAGAHINDSYIANIKIYPPELGNVLAKLKVDKTSAQLVIVTENERVKSIVEANLPQLKEHFSQSNLTLTHIQVQSASSGVGDQNQNRNQQHAEFMPDAENARPRTNSGLAEGPKDPQKTGNKIIDTYA